MEWGGGGDASKCILFGHFLPSWDWGYLEGQDPIPGGSGGHSRLPISDAGKCFPPIPPHPWTAAPVQAQGCGVGGVGAQGKARVGNVVVLIIL